jgi:hypothetical protein
MVTQMEERDGRCVFHNIWPNIHTPARVPIGELSIKIPDGCSYTKPDKDYDDLKNNTTFVHKVPRLYKYLYLGKCIIFTDIYYALHSLQTQSRNFMNKRYIRE